MTSDEVVTDVYRYLAAVDDLDALFDGQHLALVQSWLASVFERAPDEWKSLFRSAYTEVQDYIPDPDSPSYWRPSFWLLHPVWMADHGYTTLPERLPSRGIFCDNDVPIEDQIYWPPLPQDEQ